MKRSDHWVEFLVFCGQLVGLLAVRLHQFGDLAVQVVVLLSGEKHKEGHLGTLITLELLENLVKMDALDQAVALRDPKNSALEPHFIHCVDHPGFEAHLGEIPHEEMS